LNPELMQTNKSQSSLAWPEEGKSSYFRIANCPVWSRRSWFGYI